MGKRGRHRAGGRVTPRGTRPRSYDPAPRRTRQPDQPDLYGEVAGRLSTGVPLDLLVHASGLVAVLDPRRAGSFGRGEGKTSDIPSHRELTDSFADMEAIETSALLACLSGLLPEEMLRAQARRALLARGDVLPSWLQDLNRSSVYRAIEMTHALGDAEDIVLGVRFQDGQEITIVVFIDHNLGTVVKDSFPISEPIDQLVAFAQEKNDDPDFSWDELDLADARVRITQANTAGDQVFPPFETDTWPVSQPIVEWATRLLPDGGTGTVRPEWDERARQKLAKRFFSSARGRALDDVERQTLLEPILRFGTDFGRSDPMRWSPIRVEMMLVDWIPDAIVADPELLSLAPGLLRAFIEFCHGEQGIRSELTHQTVSAVDLLEPEFQRLVHSSGTFDDDLWDDEFEHADYDTIVRQILEDAVGGSRALDALDTNPLPDEDFSWEGVAEDIREKVHEVLSLCDGCCAAMLTTEYRTACRRLLARIATGGPEGFRRKGRSDTAAAAICWAVCKVNELFSASGNGMRVKDLTGHFGLGQSSVSQRADTLLKTAGLAVPTRYGDLSLGSPDLLVSERRRRIVMRRDWDPKERASPF
jgi:Domain of unknown function (DUF6398)